MSTTLPRPPALPAPAPIISTATKTLEISQLRALLDNHHYLGAGRLAGHKAPTNTTPRAAPTDSSPSLVGPARPNASRTATNGSAGMPSPVPTTSSSSCNCAASGSSTSTAARTLPGHCLGRGSVAGVIRGNQKRIRIRKTCRSLTDGDLFGGTTTWRFVSARACCGLPQSIASSARQIVPQPPGGR